MNNNVINIIERFQTHHALQEERERSGDFVMNAKTNPEFSIDFCSAPGTPSQEGVRSTLRGVLENLPHVEMTVEQTIN
jgi:hypothetical protein